MERTYFTHGMADKNLVEKLAEIAERLQLDPSKTKLVLLCGTVSREIPGD